MSDELDEQIERVIALMVEEHEQPYVMPGETVAMRVGDESFPAGVIISAYQHLLTRLAAEATEAVESMQARVRHTWALTAQNVGVAFLVLGFILVLFKGWP